MRHSLRQCICSMPADVENVLRLQHFLSPDGAWSTSRHASATPMMHQDASASQEPKQRSNVRRNGVTPGI